MLQGISLKKRERERERERKKDRGPIALMGKGVLINMVWAYIL